MNPTPGSADSGRKALSGSSPSARSAPSWRVAIVECDQDKAEILSQWFELAGHRCHSFATGAALVKSFNQIAPDVVLLGWNPSDSSSPFILRYVRNSGRPSIPVLLLSDSNREEDVADALRLGADDYLVRPVRRRELLARVEAIARRVGKVDHAVAAMEVGAIRLDCETRSVWRDGRMIEVTAKDFDLSLQFLRNVGKVLSRGHLLHTVWGHSANGLSRTLDTHVSRVRAKLGLVPEHGWRLSSIYTRGYRLDRLKETRSTIGIDRPAFPAVYRNLAQTVIHREHFPGSPAY
jgi:two-component system, OmpR family, response regulator RegX3